MLIDILKFAYPQAIPTEDFQLRDDGEGPFIDLWNEVKLGPMPTAKRLETLLAEYEAAAPARFAKEREAYFVAEVRPKREIVITRLGQIASRMQRKGDMDTALLCDAAVERLLAITTDANVLAATDKAGLKKAVLAYYWQTADMLPEEVQNAFNGIDE